MCGIAGMIGGSGYYADGRVLLAMADAMRHRGPDAYGEYVKGRVALATRRLAVIDIVGGQQPMSNEAQTVWVAFNGEIYNHAELRGQLIEKGHQFATASDTEVIVHAYEEYGAEFPRILRGMFAIAVWDARRDELLLVRDRLGVKPLLYSVVGSELVFASEFEAMLEHPRVSRDIDLEALDQYLSLMYIVAPISAYRSIRKLEAGHILRWHDGAVAVQKYWELRHLPKLDVSEEEAADNVIELLSEAVRLREVADVPVGAFLSGGIDSSIVVALMTQLSTTRRVKTFCAGFDEREFSELRYSRRVAEALGTDHHEFVVRPDVAAVLPLLIERYGEPFGDSSAVPTYYIAREARKFVTVALNGDGGDEAFGGYSRYTAMLVAEKYQRLPRLLRRVLDDGVRVLPVRLPNRTRAADFRRFLRSASGEPLARYRGWSSVIPDDWKEVLYTPEFRLRTREFGTRSTFAEYFEAADDPVDGAIAADTAVYLPNDLLVKADIATMAVSLEARSPFLDHKVMEYAVRLPRTLKVRGLVTKYLLRKRILPAVVPDADPTRRKMGFVLPISHWLRGSMRPFLYETLLSDRLGRRGLLRPAAVRRLVRDHVEGRRDLGNALWALLVLELWFQRFID